MQLSDCIGLLTLIAGRRTVYGNGHLCAYALSDLLLALELVGALGNEAKLL